MDNTHTARRPEFPKRAVVTAGMPYGNKQLHFGHIGGVFIHADIYARFLRDRIGEENVIFVSGTDCYGSPIVESYEKSKKDSGYTGTIEDFVMENHRAQEDVLQRYTISLDLFGTSAFGEAGAMHNAVSAEIFEQLRRGGYLSVQDTPQFYDPKYHVYLNGRQVTGRCPIQGCKSEIAYADECSMGHQYGSDELIAPKSVLSGERPEIRSVKNWYFDLPRFHELLAEWAADAAKKERVRGSTLHIVEEFLKPPMIYVKREEMETVAGLRETLSEYNVQDDPQKPSVTLVFESLERRESACAVLRNHGVRFRTGKTLVPFRLTGNVAWGVPVPQSEIDETLTFWVWPESLWAPISFTRALLKQRGADESEWEVYWKSPDSALYQFIGEDNVYFYAAAEVGLFFALQGPHPELADQPGHLRLPNVVANRHILFMDKKASSSSSVKPPAAGDLLDYYTPEQLRIHFFSLGLANKSVNFQPKAFSANQDAKEFDKVLKEGNLLTNVFNRLIRSCFYTLQKYTDGSLPELEVSVAVLREAEAVILKYESDMAKYEFHTIVSDLDVYLRNANKHWAKETRRAGDEGDETILLQLLADTFHVVRVGAVLLHPIAPEGCEQVRRYLGFGKEMWSWEHIFEPIQYFMKRNQPHKFQFLEPRVDFFQKHPSQMEDR